MGRVLLKTHPQQLPHALGRQLGETGPVRLQVQDRSDRVRDRLTMKCTLTRQDLVEDAAECPNVCAPVGLLSSGLLRTHELRRANDFAGEGADRYDGGR